MELFMKKVPFKPSSLVSLGVELEFQIIDPHSYGLIPRAKDLIRNIRESVYQKRIKPEITQSMIEINSSVHHSPLMLLDELLDMRSYLLSLADKLKISFCGGGTHPFQKWTSLKIFPTMRYKNISRVYRYLSKRSTVFGQHIHVGCQNSDDAIYLTHALARYVPQFIAICASSPFYQGIDTGYHSSRSNVFSSFPLSGAIPYLTNWKEFSEYFYKMRNLGVIETMKDVYWDIRPKPEFGTVEIRVCDTPLTFTKAIIIAAYIQALSHYILQKKPIILSHDLYHLYIYNRFLACRYGLEGSFIDPFTFQNKSIADDILETIKTIQNNTDSLHNTDLISQLNDDVINKKNDTVLLRQIKKQVGSLAKMVNKQCDMWSSN